MPDTRIRPRGWLALFAVPFVLLMALFTDAGNGEGEGSAGEGEPSSKGPASDGGEGDGLGDSGKRALSEERTARKAAERAAKTAQEELDKLKTASLSEQEKAVAQAKADGKAEVLKDANEKLARAEIKVAAAGKFANPALAARLVDIDDVLDKDGEPDPKKVAKAIDEILKENPGLAAAGRRPDFDAGPRGQGAPTGGGMNDFLRRAIESRR